MPRFSGRRRAFEFHSHALKDVLHAGVEGVKQSGQGVQFDLIRLDGLASVQQRRHSCEQAAQLLSLGGLRIDRIGPGNSATLEFQAVSNKTYTVQSTENLGANQWSRIADIVARATNHSQTVLDPTPATNRYYRLVTPRQP